MEYDFTDFDTQLTRIEHYLIDEYASIRAGRAAPQMLDTVRVNAYGTATPLQQVASVVTEDPRTLRVSVWDGSLLAQTESAITEADLGVSVVNDGTGLRVIVPELSSERRDGLLKLAKAKLEEARVTVRSARDDENKKIVRDLASEDEQFTAKEEVQKRIEKINKKLEELFERKQKEINE